MNWSINYPKAIKQHRCQMCGRRIDPGEKYLRGSAFGEGTAWSWEECLHCEAVRKIYDIQNEDGEYNEEMIYEWSGEFRDVSELRHAASYRMKWRTSTGNLLPIPEYVKP